MGKAFDDIMALFAAVIGLAIVAVIFSQKANTANVISNTFTGFGSLIKAAVSPVS